MTAFSRLCLTAFGLLFCALWNGQAHAQTDAAAPLLSKGELRAALIASNPVLVTRGADGQLGGVSVELARALAATLGVPVRLMPYENPARYNESLGKNEWDVGLAARDPSRAEYLAFSDVFMEDPVRQSLASFVKSNDPSEARQATQKRRVSRELMHKLNV